VYVFEVCFVIHSLFHWYYRICLVSGGGGGGGGGVWFVFLLLLLPHCFCFSSILLGLVASSIHAMTKTVV
jgi:hypothetical protein